MDDDIIDAFQKLYPGIAAWYEPAGTRAPSIQALAGGGGERNEGRFRLDPALLRQLIEGARFTHSLIATYYVVIGGLLVLLSIWHWTPRLWNIHRTKLLSGGPRHGLLSSRRGVTKDLLHALPQTYGTANNVNNNSNDDDGNGRIWNSPGPTDTVDKRHPNRLSLIKQWQTASASKSLLYKLRSWLIYQPPPVPIIHRVIPPNSTSLAISVLISINIFYTLYKIPFSLDLIFLFSTRCGLLFVANLPLLYLLAAKNNQPLLFLTGHAYETLNVYHRQLGKYMCLLAALHGAGILAVFLTLLHAPNFTWAHFLSRPVVALGLAALACYELLYATSLGAFRQACYELFLALHVLLQLAALVLVFLHHADSRPYVGVAIAIFVVDRVLFRLFVRPTVLQAVGTIHPDKATTTLTVSVPVSRRCGRWDLFRRRPGIGLGWAPAQHVFLSVPSLGLTHVLQSHPFTIASAVPSVSADTSSCVQAIDLTLLVRAKSGFSAALLRYARTHPTIEVRLDGPYGSDSAMRLLEGADTALLVAGGSGIAVVWPLVVALLNDDVNEFVAGDESRSSGDGDQSQSLLGWKGGKAREIVLVWIVRERDHVEWLGTHALDWARARGVRVVMPMPTEHGQRPDVNALVEGAVHGADEDVGRMRRKVRVVCSGPEQLSRDIRNACSRAVGRGADVQIEEHKYGW